MSKPKPNPEPAMQQQPERPVARVPWNPWLALIFTVAIFYAAQAVASLAVSVYPLSRHWTRAVADAWLTSSVLAQFVFVLLAEGLVLLGIRWWLRRYKTSFAAIGLKKPRWRDVGYGLLATPVYYLLAAALLTVTGLVVHLNTNDTQQVGFNGVHGAGPLIITYISLAILPPLTEEIMMRGFLYTSLKKAMPVIYAAVATSILFGAAHLDEGSSGLLWTAAIQFFGLSLVLVYLREKTDSLWASITLHVINNTIAFIQLYLRH